MKEELTRIAMDAGAIFLERNLTNVAEAAKGHMPQAEAVLFVAVRIHAFGHLAEAVNGDHLSFGQSAHPFFHIGGV